MQGANNLAGGVEKSVGVCLFIQMRNLLLSALILASAFQTAFGQSYTSGDYGYIPYNNQAYITYYTGAGGAVVIPSTLNSYPVVSIGQSAFSQSALTSVIIPNSVTSIGEYAFAYNPSLTNVTIPNSVTSIGYNAFSVCTGLTSITIPNSVTSIGGGAFYACSGLASITIPNSVTSIGDGVFQACTSLTSVSIPNSVTSIGSYAFSNTALTIVIIPSSVTSIGSYAFASSNLGQVVLSSTTTFPSNAFPPTAFFEKYVGSVGAPTTTATQADLASTKAGLASTKADLASTKAELAKIKADLKGAFPKLFYKR